MLSVPLTGVAPVSDYTEHVNCNLCGSTRYHLLYASTLDDETLRAHPNHFRCTTATYGKHPPIVRCDDCGLVYANPRLRSQLVEENYRVVDDPLYEAEKDGRMLTFRRNLQPLEDLVSRQINSRRLLDVGCHIGVLLQVARERGWDAVGIEPSSWASEIATRNGLTVLNTTLGQARLTPNSFDAVTIWDVIEHLTDPAQDVRTAHRLLRPGGVIAIHTIDVESLPARLLGARWPWLMEMHLYYFSPRTLGRMLTEVGFQVERVMYQGRYLRLNYLLTRLTRVSPALAQGARRAADTLRVGSLPIPINTRDIFTIFARKQA